MGFEHSGRLILILFIYFLCILARSYWMRLGKGRRRQTICINPFPINFLAILIARAVDNVQSEAKCSSDVYRYGHLVAKTPKKPLPGLTLHQRC